MTRPMPRPLLALLAASALALGAPALAAQTAVLGVRVGLDENRLDGVAAWQAEDRAALDRRGIPVAETDAFPAFLSVQAEAAVGLGPSTRVGAHVGYGSTSGRLAYADYSGSARADRLARRTFAGAHVERAVLRSGPASVWVGLGTRLSRVTVDYERRIVVGADEVEAVESSYTAWPLGVEPALAAELAAGPLATVRLQAGWEQPFGGRLSGSGPDRPAGAPRADWGGLRVGLGLAARLGGR